MNHGVGAGTAEEIACPGARQRTRTEIERLAGRMYAETLSRLEKAGGVGRGEFFRLRPPTCCIGKAGRRSPTRRTEK